MSVKMEAAFEKRAADPEEDLRAHGSGDRERHGSGRHTPLLHAPAGPMSGTAGFAGGSGWFGGIPVPLARRPLLNKDLYMMAARGNGFRIPFGNRPCRDLEMRDFKCDEKPLSPMPFGSRPSRDNEERGIYVHGAIPSPMPFGNRPSRDNTWKDKQV